MKLEMNHFLHDPIQMVNRMDVLRICVVDEQKLYKNDSVNRVMNSYLLRFKTCNEKVGTIQLFIPFSKLKPPSATCFTRCFEFDDFMCMYKGLYDMCGLQVLKSEVATTVWKFKLYSKIGDLHKFVQYCKDAFFYYFIMTCK
jgi:hypothetical protein